MAEETKNVPFDSSSLQKLTTAGAVLRGRIKKFYNFLFVIFYITLIAVIIVNVSHIWPALLTLMIGLIMTVKKAHLDRSKFARGVLIGFYGMGGIAAIVVASAFPNAILLTLAYLVGAMGILGVGWAFAMICAFRKESAWQVFKVIFLIFLGGAITFLPSDASSNLVVAAAYAAGPIFITIMAVLILLFLLSGISPSISTSEPQPQALELGLTPLSVPAGAAVQQGDLFLSAAEYKAPPAAPSVAWSDSTFFAATGSAISSADIQQNVSTDDRNVLFSGQDLPTAP